MGLDIYFRKVKKARKNRQEPLKSIDEYSRINEERARQDVSDYAFVSLDELRFAMTESEYERIYRRVISGLSAFTPYKWKYEGMLSDVKPFSEVEEFFNGFIDGYYPQADAYFRKVNFIYAYFSPKLEDEECFVTKDDILDLVSRCRTVLAEHTTEKAAELLPTVSGFFFGSTDYDEWYFKDVEDCINQMENLLQDYDEETDVIFVEMSW